MGVFKKLIEEISKNKQKEKIFLEEIRVNNMNITKRKRVYNKLMKISFKKRDKILSKYKYEKIIAQLIKKQKDNVSKEEDINGMTLINMGYTRGLNYAIDIMKDEIKELGLENN